MPTPTAKAAVFTYEELMAYGLACQREGSLKARAVEAMKGKRKAEARRFWKAYYDTVKEKEEWLRIKMR